MQPDLHESIVDLGLALVRRRGVHHRILREGYTAAVAEADRESQCDFGRALGGVYRAFGVSDDVFEDALEVADQFERWAGVKR